MSRVLRAVSRTAVEPTMIPRPSNEPSLPADTWWTAIIHHPSNRAAMECFLARHGFVLDEIAHDDEPALIDAVSEHYRSTFAQAVAAAGNSASPA